LKEASEALIEAFSIRFVGRTRRDMQGPFVEGLQNVEHRAVFVIAEAARDVNDVVGRDPNQVLVERSVVDRAEAEAVADRRLAALDVAQDVRSVEEAELLQPADRALTAVRGDDSAAEARLVEPDSRLPHGVAALDLLFKRHWLGLVQGPIRAPGVTSTIRRAGSSWRT
jgi:hypothetical protein